MLVKNYYKQMTIIAMLVIIVSMVAEIVAKLIRSWWNVL